MPISRQSRNLGYHVKNRQQPPYQLQLVPGRKVFVQGLGECVATLVYRAGDILVCTEGGPIMGDALWYVPEGQYRIL